jgi:hypothetical protein
MSLVTVPLPPGYYCTTKITHLLLYDKLVWACHNGDTFPSLPYLVSVFCLEKKKVSFHENETSLPTGIAML